MDYLISNGADINLEDNNVWAPLHYASMCGNLEVVKYLINKESDINEKNNKGNTPLHYASSEGQLELVKYLINKGADIHAKNNDRCTPLRLAYNAPIVGVIYGIFGKDTNYGHLEVVNYLKSVGATMWNLYIMIYYYY